MADDGSLELRFATDRSVRLIVNIVTLCLSLAWIGLGGFAAFAFIQSDVLAGFALAGGECAIAGVITLCLQPIRQSGLFKERVLVQGMLLVGSLLSVIGQPFGEDATNPWLARSGHILLVVGALGLVLVTTFAIIRGHDRPSGR